MGQACQDADAKQQRVPGASSSTKVCWAPMPVVGTQPCSQGKKQARSPSGSKPACDSCAKVVCTCEWPPPGRARSCKHCVHSKIQCTVSRAPQSMKRVQVTTEEDAGPSQRGEDEPLFLESESEDGAEVRMETAGSEIPGGAIKELMEALRAQTSATQGQARIEERLCTQMERLSISLDQHRNLQQELLQALQVTAQGFGHGLGSGLDTWAGIAVGWEEWSKGEEDEGKGRRCRWNDTLSR